MRFLSCWCIMGLLFMLAACGPEEDVSEHANLAQVGQAVNMGHLGSRVGDPVAAGSTSGRTNDFTATCASSAAPDVQYTWTAPATLTYTFSTAGSSFDTILEVRLYSNPSTVLGCNDDANGTVQSSLTLNVTAGTTYLINIDGYGSSSGSYALNIPPVFQWSSAGPIAGKTCVRILEPADPDTWNDNYLCSNVPYGVAWSSAGPIANMRCTQIIESADPNTWNDNYLCVPLSSPLIFSWSSAGPIAGKSCVRFTESADPHSWMDNYLCY